MKKIVSVAIVLSAVAISSASASSALDIFSTASGTAVTYDNASGAYPVITAILSQGGGTVVNGHTYNNWSFLAQDSTGSIDMFGALPSGGSYVPTVGDAISVSGTYSPYHQVPEIGSISAITQMSTGNTLPPTPVYSIADLTASTTIPQNLAGHLLLVTNVTLYTDSGATTPVAGNFADGNTALYAKDSNGDIMEIYVWVSSYSTCAAFVGTPIPSGHVDVVGFISQSGTFPVEMTPIQFIPLGPSISYTNILSSLVRPGDAPTNTIFTEYALRPGETLTINARAYDTDGSNVTLSASSTVPSGGWDSSSGSGTDVSNTFTFTPSAADAGNAYTATFKAWTAGTNTTTWSIYVPTPEEQNVIVSEFLANPTADTNSPYFNPLHRPFPGSTNAYSDDEFIEVVNANSTPLDFIGWSFYDAVTLRHQFYYPTSVDASNTVVLYGGPLIGDPAPPAIPGVSTPFSEGSPGVSVLNDSGDTISLYNPDGHLVDRVVYTSATAFKGVSWTRYPTLTNDFVQHTSVVATNASPGLQPDQQPYSVPPVISQPPTITSVANQIISQDSSVGPLTFTVGDPVTPADNLTVSGFSSDPALVPNNNIVFGGSGSNRTVTITSAAGASGVSTISLTVANSDLRNATTSFILAVTPSGPPVILFNDDFNYSDGSIITNSSFMWTNHSGTPGQMQVIGKELQVTGNQSEDVSRLIPGQPYDASSNLTLYAGFTVNFSELPSASGSYFAHFKDSATGFGARLYAQSQGAASGKFRLAIANLSGTPVQFPQDIDLNTPYAVVMSYNLTSGRSTLWVNPPNAASAYVQDTAAVSPITVVALAFRQSSGEGTMLVDNLKVGTSFDAVLPSVTPPPNPIPLTVSQSGNNLILSWTDPAFKLFSGPSIDAITNEVVGATSPYTNSVSGSAQFFRLIAQ